MRKKRLCAANHAIQVDLGHLLEVGELGVGDAVEHAKAGVVDQNIGATEAI